MISSINEESIYKVCLFTHANRIEVEMSYQMIQNLQQNKKHELVLEYTLEIGFNQANGAKKLNMTSCFQEKRDLLISKPNP